MGDVGSWCAYIFIVSSFKRTQKIMFVSFYAIIHPLDVFGYFCWVDINLLHVKKLV